jgi:hypothetical protein
VLTSVETINVTIAPNSGADTSNLNLDQSTDVTSVNVRTHVDGADTFVLSGTGTAATLTVTDLLSDGVVDVSNNYTVNYTGVSGTADVASVNIVASNADLTLGTITVGSIENLTVTASGGYDATYALSAGAATTLTLNAAADSTASDTTGGTATVTAEVATTLNVNASNDFTVNDNTNKLIKVSTVNIDSAVAGKTVTITDLTTTATASTADAVQINISGAGNASVGVDTSFGTYNATTNADSVTVAAGSSTGNITVTTNAAAANNITTGAGNDTVVLSAALTNKDSINLGGGAGDKIVTTAVYSSNAAADLFFTDATATDNPTISGVEIASIVLSDSGAASTVDVTSAAFASTVELNGDLDDAESTINNIGVNQTVKLGGTLDMSDDDSAVILTKAGATTSAPSATMNITSDLMENGSTDAANIDDLRVDTSVAVTLNLASTDTDVVGVTIDGASFDKATSVTVTSVENVTVSAIDAANGATLDFSGVSGTVALTVDTNLDYTVRGSATAASTFTMSTGLDADDAIIGGASATDKLTATVNGLNATTGALSITGVEEVEITVVTAASVINAAGITGASVIEVGNGTALTGTDLTITNLAAGTALQLGTTGTLLAKGEISVSLANAAGVNDTLVVKTVDTTTDDHIDVELIGTGIENLVFQVAEDAGTENDTELTLTNFAANKITLTGGTAGEVFDIARANAEQLNAATNEVDASNFKGSVIAVAATNTATTFSAKAASNFTGSVLADNITIGAAGSAISGGSATSIGTIDGGAGTDVLTAYLGANGSIAGVSNVEVINLNLAATGSNYSVVG